MVKQSNVNLDITSNADGFDISGGTVRRKLTHTGSDITLTGSGTNTFTFPSATDTLVGRASTDTLTNKTLGASSIAGSLTPSSNIVYSLGSTSFRMLKLWSQDADFSGSVNILGSASVVSNFTVDTNLLYVDSTTNNVLLNTSTARTVLGVTPIFQIEGTTFGTSGAIFTGNINSAINNPYLIFAKSRGATVGSNTIVQNGDRLGGVIFTGTDGVTPISAATIQVLVDGVPDVNDMPGRLEFFTTPDNSATLALRFTINSKGNFGFNGTSFADGAGVAFLKNAGTVPTTNPTDGGILYCEGGEFKFRNPSGVLSYLTPAIGDEGVDATNYVIFSNSASGVLNPKTNSTLTFNAALGTFRSTIFSSAYSEFTGDNTFPGIASGLGRIYHNNISGLIIYGEGTSYDILLANKSGSNIMSVVTGTSNVDFYGNLTVDTNVFYVDATNNRVGINKTPTVPLDVLGDILITGNGTYVGQQTLTQVILTSTSNSIAWNANSGNSAKHTATENTTLANPTNLVAGTCYTFQFTQHATTPYTLAFGTVWKFAGASTVTTTLSGVNIISGLYDGTNINAVMTGPFA